ncbi:hypothetical protein CRG98_013279, partial [Punica granatum]
MAEEQQLAIYEEDAPPTPAHSPSQGTHVIPPATPAAAAAYPGAPSMPFPPPTVRTASNVIDPARFTALEGMLHSPSGAEDNRRSESGSLTDSEEMSFSTMAYVPAVHPVSDHIPPPPAPTSVPLPPAAFLSMDSAIHTLPPLTIPAQPPTYTVPPSMVPPIVITQAPAPTASCFPFQAPQPQAGFSYPASLPLNIPPTEPGTPIQAALAALPTNILPDTENEQERRIRRMEETIRALQAGSSHFDYGDNNWNIFPGMRLPQKIKILEFKRYDGTNDPRHHLRHYQSKMMQYWDYEEFVIQTFQDNLAGSALDWLVTLKVDDIPTWTDLSQKFLDQYRFCAETPPTLLELSTMEMKENQAFEAYAAEGAYYSHLLAHTSLFSDLIEVGKKLDMGIKLGRIEGLTKKKEEEAPKRHTASTSRRAKDVTVSAVNPGRQSLQQFLVNYTPPPPVSQAYAHPVQYTPPYQTHQAYHPAPLLIIQPPPPQQHAPTQSRAPASRPSQPAQQSNTAPPYPRKQYTPLPASLSHIYRQLLAGNRIQSEAPHPNFDPTVQNQSIRCEFHQGAPGHTTDNCWRLREKIHEMVDTKQISFNEVPAKEPYQDSRVPWSYGDSVANAEQELSMMGITHSGRVYQDLEPVDKGKAPTAAFKDNVRAESIPTKKVTEEEAEAFMKVIKASEYKVVEQMGKSPAHISLLALLLSSEPHRDTLLKVLTAAQVPKETAPQRIEETVSSIFSNQVSFSEDEIPSKGQGHLRALHIVCKCNNHVIGRVMIDNGSALNVCPISTLKQMNVDMSRIRGSKTTIRAFDGSRREVNGEIDLLIDKLKFFVEGKLITVNGEEDYAIYKETVVPYVSIGEDQNPPFHSFDTISVIRDYGEVGPSRADRMIGKVLLKSGYVPRTGLGAHAQGVLHPVQVEEYRNRRGLGFRPSCHEIFHARHFKHLHHLVTHYRKLPRGIPVPPLSQFFPGPPLVVRGTFDTAPSESEDSSSDTTEALFVLPAVYAITNETSSRLPIRLAQEDEELTNWIAVPCYSTVVADVPQSNPNNGCNDSNPPKRRFGKPLPTYFGEGLDEDNHVPEIEESLHRLENHQLISVEPTEEINIGTTEEPRALTIGTRLDPAQRFRMINFLTEYQEVFAWSYADMPGLDPSIVKHFLPLDTKRFSPKRQHLRRQRDDLLLRIKEEVIKQVDAGFLEIQMAEEDKVKTTFITIWGTFCYKVMPFSLKNAGATYQRAMVTLFHDMMHKEIEGIEVDPDKVKAIMELPPPSTVREIRSFLGRLNYIARFIANLTDKCQPLFRLLRKNAVVEWDDECQKAFNTVKAYLIQPPVFVPPSPDRPLILYLTVRRQSLGCMLGQKDDSSHAERAIYYLSQKFTEGESNYPEIEKMCCALVWVMQRLRQYTLYHTIRLLSKTDPLKYLLDSPSSMRNIARWHCQLTEYDIKYVSRTSVKGQAIADHLAEFPIVDNTPINSDFPDEGILLVNDEVETPRWKMYFDGAVNSTGS